MKTQNNTTEKRLKILGADEIEAIYHRPCFTPEEQEKYFSLSETEKDLLTEFRSIRSTTYFILQLGYFKAKQLFFTFNLTEVSSDVGYIFTQYFPHAKMEDWSPIDKRTRLRQRRLILSACNYHSCSKQHRQKLSEKARQVAMVCCKPVYLFGELMGYLSDQRIVAPGYSFMQDTIAKALTDEHLRLVSIVSNHLTEKDISALKHLLEDSDGLHEITRLKREPSDFSLSEIKREIEKGLKIRHLYHLAKKLLPYLKISNENIKYYATLVNYYSVFRLRQLSEQTVYLYLLCFVYHRYQRMNDNLIKCLQNKIKGYLDEAKDAAKQRVYEYRLQANEDLQKAGNVLKLFTNDTIAEDMPFEKVQAKAFGILPRQKLEFIADQLTTKAKFDETAFAWEHIDKLANPFKRQLRPILLAVDFAASKAQAPLIEAVDFLKEAFSKGNSLSRYSENSFPIRFIGDNTKRYLYGLNSDQQKCLIWDRYEFLVYRLLRNGLEAGDIFCRDSVRFRSFDDDLIDSKQWQKKDDLIADTGLTILSQPIEDHLASLQQALEDRIAEVNSRITSGENDHIEITHRGKRSRWTLTYPHGSEAINHPFFDSLAQVDIGDVLHFVNQRCQFMEAFSHILGRTKKQEIDDQVLTACLVGWATNTGLSKMGQVSDIGYQKLLSTSQNFIRGETLQEANDRVCNLIARMPIFRHYDIDGTIHSSSDGQKFETRIHTINASHSPKYFGLKKGIVSYTLVANHVPVNARIIGANEHESHYVFDILKNNTTDIQPQVHSTDTHGTNEVNFAILHLFGYQFAPRYRDIYDEVGQSLYGFSHPSQYEGMLIKPIRKIKESLIISEWENIGRIMVSLALKTTTQNIIVSKLSAYARRNKTRQALWEYDNIIKSLYLLDYIDSVPLRKNVQRALNRGENYHKLRRAVSYANFGKLRFKTEDEQQIWNECSRLITNCIIYYNATILSNLLALLQNNGNEGDVALLRKISPVAWSHINLHGRYEFSKGPQEIDIDAIVRQLEQIHLASTIAKTP